MPSKADILDLYYMPARRDLIEIAAYLDRLERHSGEADYRAEAFHRALQAMQHPPEGQTRTQAVLHALSDHSTEPAPTAHTQAAAGAPLRPPQ